MGITYGVTYGHLMESHDWKVEKNGGHGNKW